MTATTYTQHLGSPTVRAYLAGTAASSSLVAAAVVVFLSLATLVAFNELPFGSDDRPEAAVSLGSAGQSVFGPAEAAAAAAAAAPKAIRPGAVAPSGIPDGQAPSGPGGELFGPGSDPPLAPPPGGDPPIDPPGGETPRVIGGFVTRLDGTTDSLGLGGPLAPLTGGLTGSLDEGLVQTLDGVGNAIGSPGLGKRVSGVTNQLGGVLFEDGLRDRTPPPPQDPPE